MGRLVMLGLVALTGCVEPAPDPAWERLTSGCEAGDTQACAVIVEQQHRHREALQRATTPAGLRIAQSSFSVAMAPRNAPPPTQPLNSDMKVCPNGQIVQQFYIC